jgi:hypothetical protein
MRPCCVLLLLLAAGSGCATIFSSSRQNVVFSSNPARAEVLVDGARIGVTPLTWSFDRDTFATHVITMRGPGLEPARFQLQKSLNGVAIFNLTSGLFWVTDAATGALIQYSPSAYHLELRPAWSPPPPAPPPPPAGPGDASDETTAAKDAAPAGGDRAALWFVLVNDTRIRTEIARGRGEYLGALARLWRIEADLSRMTAALGREAPVLLARTYPYELYLEIRRVLADERLL